MGANEQGIRLTADDAELALNAMRRKEFERLDKSRPRPFFARVDFRERGQPDRERAYVGRFGLFDPETLEPIVLDWRAPMAALYYEHDFRGVPVEVKHGRRLEFDVSMRRQFEMEGEQIARYSDMTEASGANRLLVERLRQRGEQKLRDIVETIQAEQNAVLRADAGQALIVQGAAGSGKTTIALHRLAFLAYSYRDRGMFDNFLIIAPNRLFIDYISDVLPELGVEGVVQTTWEEALQRLIPLPKGSSFEEASAKTALILEGKLEAMEAGATKAASIVRGTMAMKPLLDRYIERRIETTLPEGDLALSKTHRMSAEEIRRRFHTDYRHYPYMQRRRRLFQSLTQWKDECAAEAQRVLESRVKPGQIAETERRVAEIRAQYDRKLEEYIARVKSVEIVSFYRSIMAKPANIARLLGNAGIPDAEGAGGVLAERIADRFAKDGQQRKKLLEWEDIAPLFYVTHRFYGPGKAKAFSHIIVDEAQDFSPFQLHVLSLLSAGGSMTILGDLAQSIYPHRGLTDWNAVAEGVFPARTTMETLRKSYRSTVEIMTAAGSILARARLPGVEPPEPVLRRGEAPSLRRYGSEIEAYRAVAAELRALQDAGLSNVAVIGKTASSCRRMHRLLTEAGVAEARLLGGKASAYEGGVSVLPAYLAKGMEFDAVLLINPAATAYDPAVSEDAKQLYVACTRALHRLAVHGWEEPTPLLADAFPSSST